MARAGEDALAAAPWFEDLRAALAVSREHRPPPLALPSLVRRCYRAALACLRVIAHDLE
jgi:hypothetical protein